MAKSRFNQTCQNKTNNASSSSANQTKLSTLLHPGKSGRKTGGILISNSSMSHGKTASRAKQARRRVQSTRFEDVQHTLYNS